MSEPCGVQMLADQSRFAGKHRSPAWKLPTLIIATVVASTIWGEFGLLPRYELQVQLGRANDRVAAVERENQRLLREVTLMERDPAVLERVVAEELSWGTEGAVIYRFDEPR